MKNRALGGVRIVSANREPDEPARRLFLPFGGKLAEDNRWVLLAQMIPWWMLEEKYAKNFKKSLKGQKAVSIRIALGALIILERLGTDDRETLRQILENPYLQYFLGLPEYRYRRPFHHSLMTHFRKRLGGEILDEVNEWIALEEARKCRMIHRTTMNLAAELTQRPVSLQKRSHSRWN